MQIYLAPMEGITGYVVRNAFLHHFGCIDEYFTPFIPASRRLGPKISREVSPYNNKDMVLIPQLISNDAEEMPRSIQQLKDLGYTEFNINLGCPSNTVAGKGRGSGMLKDVKELDQFLEKTFKTKPEGVPLSIKTRIGFDDPKEWPKILDIYENYPIKELIIHPRVRNEFYRGEPHMDAFEYAYNRLIPKGWKLCYNGDIKSVGDYERILKHYPDLNAVMIGRGLLAKPDLACKIKGVTLPDTKKAIQDFYHEIYNVYLTYLRNEQQVQGRMKEIWAYLRHSFKDSDAMVTELLHTKDMKEFKALSEQIFDTLELNDR